MAIHIELVVRIDDEDRADAPETPFTANLYDPAQPGETFITPGFGTTPEGALLALVDNIRRERLIDKESSASSQHYIDTGDYLYHGEGHHA